MPRKTGATGPNRPSLTIIGETQNLDENLRRQFAARQFYQLGKRVHFAGTAVAIILALFSPAVLLFAPIGGPFLGAIGGLWTFVSRVALERFKQGYQLNGASAQEMFDSSVLDIAWNDALARRLSEEEIHRASGAMKEVEKYKSWYPADSDLAWPCSVLICQRSNAVWARRQHRAFGKFLQIAAAAWFSATALTALSVHASLSQYLTTILLPSLPAFLDAVELSNQHAKASGSRQLLEDQIDKLLARGVATDKNLREIQDQLFTLRRDAPLVPEWFYRVVRSNYEADMRYAADLAAHNTPSSSVSAGAN